MQKLSNNRNIVNVAIIGTGFGSETHLPAFYDCKKAKVYTIFGRDMNKAKKLAKAYNTEKIFNSYNELLKDKNIDLVSISLPPNLQYKYVDKALDAGKHILCEKPFTTSKNDAIKLYKKAKQKKLLNAVGYQLRFQPARRIIKNFLDGNDLGKVISINMNYDFSSRIQSKPTWNWWSSFKEGGGVLNAMGSHQLDLLRWWFGDPVEVAAYIKNYNKTLDDEKKISRKVEADEISQILLKFKNDIICNLNISSVAIGWKASMINIYAEKGSLFLEGEEDLKFVRKTTAKHNLTEKETLLNKSWISGSIWRAAFYRQVETLIDSLIDNKGFEGANFYDGYKVQEIIDTIRYSSKRKKSQTIKYK